MKGKNEIREELKKLSPFLLDMKDKGEGFKVPKNYFKSLPDEVLKQIQETPNPVVAKPKMNLLDECIFYIKWLMKPQRAMVLAAAVVLIIAGVFLFNDGAVSDENTLVSEETTIQLEELSMEELEAYVHNNIEEFGEEIFVEAGESLEKDPLIFDFDAEADDAIINDLLDEMDLSDFEDIL